MKEQYAKTDIPAVQSALFIAIKALTKDIKLYLFAGQALAAEISQDILAAINKVES